MEKKKKVRTSNDQRSDVKNPNAKDYKVDKANTKKQTKETKKLTK